MKIVFFFAVLFCFSSFVYSQTVKNEAKDLADDYKIAKKDLGNCYYSYFQKKTGLEVLRKCETDAKSKLYKSFSVLSKNSDAMKMIIADELAENFSDQIDGLSNKTELRLDSQIELLRIIVLQNQRIIELLENKKP